MTRAIGLVICNAGLFLIHFGMWWGNKGVTWAHAKTVIDDMLTGGEIAQQTRLETQRAIKKERDHA